MNRIMRLVIFVAIWGAVPACDKKGSRQVDPQLKPALAEKDLWELAPRDATMAVVISDGALIKVRRTLVEFDRVLRGVPVAQLASKELRRELQSFIALDLFDDKALPQSGLDISGGLAIFRSGSETAFVLPVADRDAFRRHFGATANKTQPEQLDQLRHFVCKPISARYVCATNRERLEMVASGGASIARRMKALPSNLRGEIEFAGDLAQVFPSATRWLQDPGLVVLSAKLGDGRLEAQLWLQAKPLSVIAAAKESHPRGLVREEVIDRRHSGFFHLFVPTAALVDVLVEMKFIDDDLAGIIRNTTGELVGTSPASGSRSVAVVAALHDHRVFVDLVDAACRIPYVQVFGLEVSGKRGNCSGTLEPSRFAQMVGQVSPSSVPIPASLKVAPGTVTLTIGSSSKQRAVKEGDYPTSTARDLAEGDWTYAIWGESLAPMNADGELGPGLGNLLSALPAELTQWVGGHVSELGIGFAVREDGIHGQVTLITFAADEDDVYDEFEGALTDAIAGRSQQASERLTKLAESAPNSLAARQARVTSGAPAVLAGFAPVLTVAAIPTFLKYLERSKDQ